MLSCKKLKTVSTDCEPVWPSGKASVRFRFGSPLSRFRSCGLRTLSCDFVAHN